MRNLIGKLVLGLALMGFGAAAVQADTVIVTNPTGFTEFDTNIDAEGNEWVEVRVWDRRGISLHYLLISDPAGNPLSFLIFLDRDGIFN